ncbi:MAG: hypothetical protein IKP38_10015 [Clostridia bacterium]|nr:hypothetical protein [Clostridia bacterium]
MELLSLSSQKQNAFFPKTYDFPQKQPHFPKNNPKNSVFGPQKQVLGKTLYTCPTPFFLQTLILSDFDFPEVDFISPSGLLSLTAYFPPNPRPRTLSFHIQ